MICDGFFSILPKLHFISTPWSEVHFTYCFPSQQVVGSFEPGLVLQIFSRFPASRLWDSILSFAILFCNKRVAENILLVSCSSNENSSLTPEYHQCYVTLRGSLLFFNRYKLESFYTGLDTVIFAPFALTISTSTSPTIPSFPW